MRVLKHGKYLISLALPAIAAMASTTVMNNVDLAMVGRLGAGAIAAVGMSGVVAYNFAALFNIGLSTAVNFLVAQSYGAGNLKIVYRRTMAGMVLAMTLGVAVAAGAWAGAGYFLRGLGASPEVVKVGTGFLRFRLASIPFIMVMSTLGGFLRGRGDTGTPALIMLFANVLNVVLNYVFIFGAGGFPALGVAGSGLATLLSEASSAILFFYVFLTAWRKETVRIPLGTTIREIRQVSVESVKIGIQEMGMSLPMLVFTSLVARFGDVALAANEVALNFLGFGFLPAYGFGIAATTAVGQRLGKGEVQKAREMGRDVTILGLFFMLGMGVLFFALAPFIARLYTTRASVAVVAVKLIRLAAFFQIFDGTQIIMGGTLRGAGDNTFLVYATLGAGWVFFIPVAYLLAETLGLGVTGAWLGLYSYITLLSLIMVIRFKRLPWERIRLL